MVTISPFKALRPAAELAKQVASRPYDVLNSKEAKTEAQGNNATSIGYINSVRTRAGVTSLSTSLTTAQFEQALSNERRLEFAFENQRFFDLVRFNTTMTTITAEQTIKNHFAREYAKHYANYPVPRLTLAELQAKVDANHLLLPIPQYELDTNTQLAIAQNPGY